MFADSRDVATTFGKLHKHVIRDICELITKDPALNGSTFGPVDYLDQKGERRACYQMDREGFTRLVMGFTGEKAGLWVERYIEAFNQMEAALRSPAAPAGH